MDTGTQTKKVNRVAIVGDVAMEVADPTVVLAKAAPFLRESGIAFCNCEWPLTDRSAPWPGKVGRGVRSHPSKIETYTFAGFDAVGLANNHTHELRARRPAADYRAAGCGRDQALWRRRQPRRSPPAGRGRMARHASRLPVLQVRVHRRFRGDAGPPRPGRGESGQQLQRPGAPP